LVDYQQEEPSKLEQKPKENQKPFWAAPNALDDSNPLKKREKAMNDLQQEVYQELGLDNKQE